MSTWTSDPINNVLIDDLLERGLVRSIEVWTDDEAEQCRLAAFAPCLRNWPMSRGGRSSRLKEFDVTRQGERRWVWDVSLPQWTMGTTIERFLHSFDAPDFAIGASVHAELAALMARGRKLPAKYRLRGKPYAKVIAAVSP